MAVAEICLKGGYADATLDELRAKFAGMNELDTRRRRELKAKNSKLNHMLAEALLDMHTLKCVLGVKR